MANRPLKVKYSGLTPIGYQEMTDADIDYTAHQIGVAIASKATGDILTVNTNGYGGSIGGFYDTYRPYAVGTHPVGTTIYGNTQYMYQVANAYDTSTYTRPLESYQNNSELQGVYLINGSGVSVYTGDSVYGKSGNTNNAWDTHVYSSAGAVYGARAVASPVGTSTHVMFGLNSDPLADGSYASIDYAFYFDIGTIRIYESGSSIGSYGTYNDNTVCTIQYDGKYVHYYVDSTRVRSVARAPGSALYFDSSFYEIGSKLAKVKFGNVNILRQMDDSTIYSSIFTKVLYRLSQLNVGAYALRTSAPGTGGTWVAVGSLTDTAQSGNSTTYLWRCTNSTAPTVSRPVCAAAWGGGAPGVTYEPSDGEIKTLFSLFSYYVYSTGIGRYALQQTAPTGGTWVKMGDTFNDTIQQVSNISYTGSYAASFSSTYAAGYASTYAANYSVTYAAGYGGYYSASYTGSYTRSYAGVIYGYYSGSYAGSRLKYFSGSRTYYYAGSRTYYYAGSRTYYYAGARDHTYTGLTVVSTKDSPSNVSLWLRTA